MGLEPSHLILRSRQLSHANATLLRFVGRLEAEAEAETEIVLSASCTEVSGSVVTSITSDGIALTEPRPGNRDALVECGGGG